MAVRVLLPVVPDLGAAAVRPEFLPPLPLKIPEYNDSHQRILTFADFAGEKIVGGDKIGVSVPLYTIDKLFPVTV